MTSEKDNDMDDEVLALVEAALGMSLRGYRRDHESVRDLVRIRLEQIVAHDFGRLPQILYRLDIAESRVDRVFESAPDSSAIPFALADLVMERLESISMARRSYETGEES